jgi:flagellar hook-basal body complex protein FliE
VETQPKPLDQCTESSSSLQIDDRAQTESENFPSQHNQAINKHNQNQSVSRNHHHTCTRKQSEEIYTPSQIEQAK